VNIGLSGRNFTIFPYLWHKRRTHLKNAVNALHLFFDIFYEHEFLRGAFYANFIGIIWKIFYVEITVRLVSEIFHKLLFFTDSSKNISVKCQPFNFFGQFSEKIFKSTLKNRVLYQLELFKNLNCLIGIINIDNLVIL